MLRESAPAHRPGGQRGRARDPPRLRHHRRPADRRASKAGLAGLTSVLANRTALEPGDPIGVDPTRDELAFYPLLYWPIVASRPQPSETAIRRLDAFMKGGGTVIFDTRDALSSRPGGATSPEAQYLRRMLTTLDIPELEPVPRDHVLTKTFYILDNFPGRYATGRPGSRSCRPRPRARNAGPPARATASRRSSSPRTTLRAPGRSAGAAKLSTRSSAATRSSGNTPIAAASTSSCMR